MWQPLFRKLLTFGRFRIEGLIIFTKTLYLQSANKHKMETKKTFCTAGPVSSDINYMIDPLKRINLEEVEELISQRKYFVLHAPRQSGKTSSLLALRDHINAEGKYIAVYVNVEGGQAMRNDVNGVIRSVLTSISERACNLLGNSIANDIRRQVINENFGSASELQVYLSRLSRALQPKPLILFIDEIDSLIGDSLISVLRQIRAGYDSRPAEFPQTIVLCGVRDVRDYRITQSNQEVVTGGSAFNIKAASLRLGDFSKEEIRELYSQHTAATGQIFENDSLRLVWEATEGQPWLVNALAYEVTENMRENRDRSVRITADMIYRAQERIIYRRETHIDQLNARLSEERVRRVLTPIIAGDGDAAESLVPQDDVQYCLDLGLIKTGQPLRIANAIYREVIPRELTWTTQEMFAGSDRAWYIRPDGRIDMSKLMTEFQKFFRQNADSWIEKFDYKESGPQLLMQAFLQRIVNGGGYIDREYGIGRGRTDILVRKPLTDKAGGTMQYIVIELKILRGDREKCIERGLEQTYGYIDKCGMGDEGHFVLFDRSKGKTWEDKIFHETREYRGREIHIWGM